MYRVPLGIYLTEEEEREAIARKALAEARRTKEGHVNRLVEQFDKLVVRPRYEVETLDSEGNLTERKNRPEGEPGSKPWWVIHKAVYPERRKVCQDHCRTKQWLPGRCCHKRISYRT